MASEAVLNGYGYHLTQRDTTAQHQLGLKIHTSLGKAYRYVKAAAIIAIGSGVRRKVDESNEPWVVEYSTETTDELFGVAHAAFAANEYGFVQVDGPCDSVNVATGVAAGDPLVCSATDGRLAKSANTDISGIRAVAIDAESSNAAQVDLRCG